MALMRLSDMSNLAEIVTGAWLLRREQDAGHQLVRARGHSKEVK